MKRFASPFSALPIAVLAIGLGGYASPTFADWPAFLGGQAKDQIEKFSPPIEWSPTENIAWQAEITGYGQSSPVIVGDRVYVTSIEGPMKESNLVACYSLADGTKQWEKSFPSSLQVKNDLYTSRAAPTPTADDAGVYAFFESGNLVALAPNGDLRWERDLMADYGKFDGRFGLGGSLVQNDSSVFVLADNDGAAYIAAFDKSNGKTIWKTDRAPRISWSSPTLVPVGDSYHLVVSSSGSVDGYHPGSGALLWTFDDVGGNTVATPLAAGDARFLVGASPGRSGENAEGAKQSNMMMQIVPVPADGATQYVAKVVWRNEAATSSFGSPIAYRGYAYYTNRAGVLYCIDLNSGDTAYTTRLPQSNWATPYGIGENVFIFGKSGTTSVMAVGDEINLVAENQLWVASEAEAGETLYGVAPLPDGFLVRTGTRLFRIVAP